MNTNKNKSLFFSIANQRCPSCRHGKLFQHSTYHLSKFAKMYDNCTFCKQPFQIEPSFFYGAMYVSYMIQVAIIVSVFVALSVLFPAASLSWYIANVVVFVLLLFPWVFRISRTIWIHIFIKYKKNESQPKHDE